MANLFNAGSNYSLSYNYYIPYGYKFPVLHAENCGMVDLGTLNWGLNNNTFYCTLPNRDTTARNIYLASDEYTFLDENKTTNLSAEGNLLYSTALGNVGLYVTNFSYTDSATFKAAMSGKYVYYQRTTDTSWTAPTITNIYDDSQLLKVGTYADNIASGVRTNNVGIKVLTGTETVAVGQVGTNYTSFNVQDVFTNAVISHAPMCSHFVGTAVTGLYNSPDSYPNQIHCQGQYSRCLLSSPNENGTTPTDFKTWLAAQYSAGTPVTVYYPLATPTTEEIETPIIKNEKNDNYIEVNTEVKGDVSAKFRGRVK